MMLKRLKLHQLYNGVPKCVPTHKHGCRRRSRNLKISAKKDVLLVLSGKKQISPLLAPIEKRVE